MKIDFHVHTNKSIDSIIKPKELARKSMELGVIPAITDHNNIDVHEIFRSFNVPFIPGEEIRTDRGDLIGLYLNQAIPRKTPFMEAVDRIHEQGGIAYLPHMYDTSRKGVIPSQEEAKKIDIIEVFNSRCLENSFNVKAIYFAEQNGMLKAAGSDTHFLFEFGSTYNELPDFDLDNPKELLKAVKNATMVRKKAPFYVRGTTTMVTLAKKFIKRIRPR